MRPVESEHLKGLPQLVLSRLSGASQSLWVGAISFEDRCVASLRQLAESSVVMSRAIALEYPTSVHPVEEDRVRRARNRAFIDELAENVFRDGLRVAPISAYALQDLQELITSELAASRYDEVVLDITCLTKIHALAMAAFLATTAYQFGWSVAYSIPENYGNLDGQGKGLGWKDVIFAPLADTADLRYEAYSRGLIVPGHESDRLWVALTEIEPSGGVVILGDTPKRPDLRRLCERLNQPILTQLRKMRSREWSQHTVGVLDIVRLKNVVMEEIKKAREKSAPIILFPYGPKAILFEISLILTRAYPRSSWFVYPIPYTYDINYSDGISGTAWYVDSNQSEQIPTSP